VFGFTPPLLYPRERAPGTYLTRGLVGPRDGLDTVARRKKAHSWVNILRYPMVQSKSRTKTNYLFYLYHHNRFSMTQDKSHFTVADQDVQFAKSYQTYNFDIQIF